MPAPHAEDGLPLPQRYWAILTIVLGITMAVIDGAIANVALPTIAENLHASPAFSIWIVNGYQLAITISLLPLAALGEIIGYRRVYLAGLALFTVASLLCALSHTLVLLTAARIVQGFGAAGIMSVNAALVRFTYPRNRLGRGIGINALVVAVSAAVGPDPGRGHSVGGHLALAVRRQYSGRRACGVGRPARLAAHAARAASLRLAGRDPQRHDVRAGHRRHRQCRPWRGALSLPVGVRRRGHRLLCLGAA